MSKNNIFRMFKMGETKEGRVEKRKAQLRHAQQTYKERKERYAKTLESEVATARGRESELFREVQSLQQTVHQLVSHMHRHGIEVPDDIYLPLGFDKPQLSVITPPWSPDSDRSPKAHVPSPGRPEIDAAAFSLIRPTEYESRRLGDLDPLVVGMEFVLELESPCLDHLHGSPDKPHEADGHILTVSGQLTSMCPHFPTNSPGSGETYRRELPEASLQNLLSLSSVLCSEYEITPVQAWNNIRTQVQFAGIELRNLRLLAKKMRDEAKCYGFGAVILQDVFKKLVYETLLLERSF